MLSAGCLPPKVLRAQGFECLLTITTTSTPPNLVYAIFTDFRLSLCQGFLKLAVWLYVDLRESPVSMEMEVNHTTERAASQAQEVISAGEVG